MDDRRNVSKDMIQYATSTDEVLFYYMPDIKKAFAFASLPPAFISKHILVSGT